MKPQANFTLRAGDPAGVEVMRVSDALLQNAVRRIEHPSRNREEDIHSVRTAIKRVRAILRLLRPAIGDPTFRRENTRLKETARLLASMRDAAVGLQTLRGLASTASRERKRSDVSIVHARFAKQVALPAAIVRERVLRATVRALENHRRRLRRLGISTDDWQAIELGLEKVYRACKRRMKRAFSGGSDDSFHRWRIRLKNLYYELQFLTPLWPKRMHSLIAGLKKAEELMGDDHDLTVLKADLRKTPSHFGDGRVVKRVLSHLKERSRKLRRACQPLAEMILKEKPRDFVREFDWH